MMSRFRQWLKDRTRSNIKSRNENAFPGPLPFRDEWPQVQQKTRTDYGYFTRLPQEIRHHILGEAFGNRTVHVDLAFDYPLIRGPASKRKDGQHKPSHCGFGSELIRDTRRPKQRQWFSCVCHRRAYRIDEQGQSGAPWHLLEPCEDGCIPGPRIGKRPGQAVCSGSLCLCESPGYSPSDCFIGVTGWLVTCRQA